MHRLVALFFCLSAPAIGETRQHGNLVFTVPPGWVVGATRDDGVLILMSDLPDDECEFCLVYITPGHVGQRRLDTYLFTQTTRFGADVDTPYREVIMQPETFDISGRPGALLGQSVDNNVQVLMAVQLTDRIELIAFEGDAADEAEARESLAVFQRDVVPILANAGFVSEGARTLMPAAVPGALSGVYWGTFPSGLDGLMTMALDHRFLTFWPSGYFYEGTPPAGLAPIDPADRVMQGDMSWGTYRLSDHSLRLSFASGEVKTLLRQGLGFMDDDVALAIVTPLADGTRISGTFTSSLDPGQSSASDLHGALPALSIVAFLPDGTWRRAASAIGFAAHSATEATGTYQIRDGLIIRVSDDGSDAVSDLVFNVGNQIRIGGAPVDIRADKNQ